MRRPSDWPLYGKYAWLEPGATVKIIGVSGEFQRDKDGELTLSYEREKCDTATVLGTWRHHGSKRWVEVRFDPPNFGTTLKMATDLRPVEESDE